LKLVAKNGDEATINSLVNDILLKKAIDENTKGDAFIIFDCIPKTKASKFRRKMNALK
jgi:hypothetical protein